MGKCAAHPRDPRSNKDKSLYGTTANRKTLEREQNRN